MCLRDPLGGRSSEQREPKGTSAALLTRRQQGEGRNATFCHKIVRRTEFQHNILFLLEKRTPTPPRATNGCESRLRRGP
jgi:hypothetical protein